jgi:hypothetical protein
MHTWISVSGLILHLIVCRFLGMRIILSHLYEYVKNILMKRIFACNIISVKGLHFLFDKFYEKTIDNMRSIR